MIINDKSFGVIPYYKDSQGVLYFCIVHHSSGHWSFPKGHPNDGETEEETALRELREETGIDQITLIKNKIFFEAYSFDENDIHYNKTVTYFIGSTLNRDKVTSEEFKAEIPELKWVTYEEGQELTTFVNAKRILAEAYQFITMTS